MKRVEIIGNRSIEEDLFELFQQKGLARKYTKLPLVHGIGTTNPKLGDPIWPEENFLLILYCDEEEASAIREIVKELREYFPTEGIRMFEMHAEQTV
ncbi:MAG: PG0541 family transporter-associated protein [Spirochaetales bacterium]